MKRLLLKFLITVIIFSFAPGSVAIGLTTLSGGDDLMSLSPVTDQILMLHIRDGHILTYGLHERPEDNITHYAPTDLCRAMQTNRYTLFSEDDPNHANGLHSVHTGRKSKGLEYQNIPQDPPFEIRIHISQNSGCHGSTDDSSGEFDRRLYQYYPRPFLLRTFIRFDLPHNSPVTLNAYDLPDQLHATLIEKQHILFF